MPELPEVETIVNDLRPVLEGRQIIGLHVNDPLLVRFPQREDFHRRLMGRIIIALTRRGKYIAGQLNGGLTWLIHLRMTGRLLTGLTPGEKYQRARFNFDDGSELWYCDLRRFGDMWAFWPGEEEHLGGFVSLGPEPLSGEFNRRWLSRALAGRKASIKALLLNQAIVAGLGNIYVDEALFRAGIFPGASGGSLSDDQCDSLVVAVKEVLSAAIEGRGTTFRDYRSGLGTAGLFQDRLQVYGRGGLPCLICGSALEKVREGGRTTVYCPRCQK